MYVDKKLIIGLMLILLMLTISFLSAANTTYNTTKKESPLFSIRTRQAIDTDLIKITQNFIKNRIKVNRMPVLFAESNLNVRNQIPVKITNKCNCHTSNGDPYKTCGLHHTCRGPFTYCYHSGCTSVPLCGFSYMCTLP